MSTNFLYKQMPNRVGNQSTHKHSHMGGATAVVGNKVNLSQPSGKQGAPEACCDTQKGRGQKVMVDRPKSDCGPNDSYRNSSYLK